MGVIVTEMLGLGDPQDGSVHLFPTFISVSNNVSMCEVNESRCFNATSIHHS